MEIAKDTPTRALTIKGLVFSVPTPYTEGHVLKANEAQVLNQTLSENLRNNFANTVNNALEAAGGDAAAVDAANLQAQLDAYIAEYEFGVRRTGGGGGAPKLEPRVKIARDLAVDQVKALIRQKGHKISDFTNAKLNELAISLVEKNEWFLEEADRQIAAQQAIAIDHLDIGAPDKEPVSDEADADRAVKKKKK